MLTRIEPKTLVTLKISTPKKNTTENGPMVFKMAMESALHWKTENEQFIKASGKMDYIMAQGALSTAMDRF